LALQSQIGPAGRSPAELSKKDLSTSRGEFSPRRPFSGMSTLVPPVRTDGRLQGPLSESASFVLMQAGRLAMQWSAEALEVFDLTLPEFAALALLQRMGPISQAGIADRLGISKAPMSRLATRLERGGLVQRELTLWDARKRVLRITLAGAELVAEAADELAAVDNDFLQRAGEDALRALAELLPPELSPVEAALRATGRG
jgi:DNA-binding MarR family transcriptional regulator